MAILTREACLEATVVPSETVAVPELGGDVVVRGMTAKERTQFEKKFVSEVRGKTRRNFDAFREQLVVFCCVEPRFTEADIEALSLVRADVIERIANVAAKLSGITEKDIDELGQSSASPTPSSTSSSHLPVSSTAPSV